MHLHISSVSSVLILMVRKSGLHQFPHLSHLPWEPIIISVQTPPPMDSPTVINHLYHNLHLPWTPPLLSNVSVITFTSHLSCDLHLLWPPMDSPTVINCLYHNLHLPWTPPSGAQGFTFWSSSYILIPKLHLLWPPMGSIISPVESLWTPSPQANDLSSWSGFYMAA